MRLQLGLLSPTFWAWSASRPLLQPITFKHVRGWTPVSHVLLTNNGFSADVEFGWLKRFHAPENIIHRQIPVCSIKETCQWHKYETTLSSIQSHTELLPPNPKDQNPKKWSSSTFSLANKFRCFWLLLEGRWSITPDFFLHCCWMLSALFVSQENWFKNERKC